MSCKMVCAAYGHAIPLEVACVIWNNNNEYGLFVAACCAFVDACGVNIRYSTLVRVLL